MSLPLKSLDAVTELTNGTPKDLETCKSQHTMHVAITGSPSTVHVELQGSMDGSTWFNLTTATTPGLFRSDPYAIRFVRAAVTQLDGGTTPTVTAWIASA